MKKTATEPATYATQESISQRARELWERYGRPEGRDTEIWLEAERQLLGVDAQVEGEANASVSAQQLDESTSYDKPRTRAGESTSVRKPAASSAKTASSAKSSAPQSVSSAKSSPALKTATSDKPALSARSKRQDVPSR